MFNDQTETYNISHTFASYREGVGVCVSFIPLKAVYSAFLVVKVTSSDHCLTGNFIYEKCVDFNNTCIV